MPIILVGLRKDLREDLKTIEDLRRGSQKPITYQEVLRLTSCHLRPLLTVEQGEELGEKIGAYKYFECSAPTKEGVSEVFEEATRVSLLVKGKGKKKGKKTGENVGAIRRLFSRSGILGS